jgi:hypothetical protein
MLTDIKLEAPWYVSFVQVHKERDVHLEQEMELTIPGIDKATQLVIVLLYAVVCPPQPPLDGPSLNPLGGWLDYV